MARTPPDGLRPVLYIGAMSLYGRFVMKTPASPSFLALAVLAALPGPLAAQATHTITPFQQQPGQVLVTTTVSKSPNGTITITEAGTETKGKMTFDRDRQLERTITDTGGQRSINYRIVRDTTKTVVDFDGQPKPETSNSPLAGQTISALRDATGAWRFRIPGTPTPTADQSQELTMFESYENNNLYPQKAVRVKETWPVQPEFLAHLTERGIGLANVDATARLDQITEVDGIRTAIITLAIETVATEGTRAEGGSGSTFKASGELHISLDSMLDRKLVLFGYRRNVTVNGGDTTRTHLPFRIEVTKTLRQ